MIVLMTIRYVSLNENASRALEEANSGIATRGSPDGEPRYTENGCSPITSHSLPNDIGCNDSVSRATQTIFEMPLQNVELLGR